MKPSSLKLLVAAVAAVLVVILAVVIPRWIHARTVAMENACIDHLRRIDAAKWNLAFMSDKTPKLNPGLGGGQIWAFELLNTSFSNATPTWDDIARYVEDAEDFHKSGPRGEMRGFRVPQNPPGATYTIGRMADSPVCSYPGHVVALYYFGIHVGDASISTNIFEQYNPPGKRGYIPRRIGSIVGATVIMLDESGHQTKAVTGDDGMAYVDIWPTVHNVETLPSKPIALIVSKEGFQTYSNSISNPYQYAYNILLQAKPK
jgi:hypothetical protein